MKTLLVLALFAAAVVWGGAAQAVDVYKWKDSKGLVHYGERRPPASASAVVLRVPDDEPSEEDEEASNERLEQAREKLLERSDTEDEAEADLQRREQRHAKTLGLGCAQAWQRYDAAAACFAAHRVASGKGVTDYGVAVCKQVTQPTCAR